MTLMRFDPFRDLDRFSEQVLAGTRSMRVMPMEAFRRGDEFLVALDLPGVAPEDVDVTVERNVVNIRAKRGPMHKEDDELLVDERAYGEFSRQLLLGDNLDTSKLAAEFDRGELHLRIPVAEASKPRRVQISAQSAPAQRISAEQQQPQTANA
jgi:HSP20 family protein